MYKSLEVKKDIYWVGALDFDLRTFDIIMHSDYGTTYNSYIMKGEEKTVLFEIAKESFFDEFLERVKTVCDPSEIDYVVVSHTEPDHTGSLSKLLELNPNMEVIGSGPAIKNLKQITNRDFKSKIAKDNETIDIGGKTLKFISVPYLHWPDSMYTYIPECKTLVTCDSFGCHYCDERVFNDKIGNADDFLDAYKYYFDCIMGPFKSYVLNALNKIKDLDIETICNGHGPVIRENVSYYLNLYREWATVNKREVPKIVIAYLTSYGYTGKLASSIFEGIKSNKNVDVVLCDMLEVSEEKVLEEISDAKGLLVGSPTLICDTLPPVLTLLSHLNPVINEGLLAGAFGSYGWTGEAVDNIEQRFEQLKFKMPLKGMKICFNPSEDDLKNAYEFGEKFAEEVLNAKK